MQLCRYERLNGKGPPDAAGAAHRVSSWLLRRTARFQSFTRGLLQTVNKHKPWIETSYHGVITENMDTVLLDPPLVALDKDAPVPYAGIELS
ncbi:calsyntenin-2-like isoform X1 [Labeo rohita]|uniref:Calsyntenin-2-like isoform X1 n=1 Tax=Labeo rohita TaxID=84645 RepID=A0A498LDM5_LABRO|nr:calsyntenin-2-like isoform X1 [Labeo rohita]